MTSQQELKVTPDGTTQLSNHDVIQTSLLQQPEPSLRPPTPTTVAPPVTPPVPPPVAPPVTPPVAPPVAPPVGGGWRYMVVLGSFLMHLLLGGFNRSYGVIYLQLLHRYHGTAALTAGVGGMATAMRSFAAPLVGVMIDRVGGRMTAVVGGLMLGLCVSVTAFVPNTETVFITLGLLAGVSSCLPYIPSIVTVGQYFRESRATALGVACSGSGVGVFILPLLMEALFDHYGYQGGMVLIGGLLLNTVVAGCLYRPLHAEEMQEEEEEKLVKEDKLVMNEDSVRHPDVEQRAGKPDLARQLEHGSHRISSTGKTEKICHCPSPLRTLSHSLHLSLLADKSFLAWLIAQVLISACYIPAQMLLPALATSRGHSTQSAMLILSILGGTDVVGRLAGGALFDLPWVKGRLRGCFSVVLLLTALSVLAMPAAGDNYALLAVEVAVHGLVSGALVTLKGVMVVHLVGTGLFAGGLGLNGFAQGVGIMTAPPIAGLLRDVTLSYTWSFIFLGTLGLISAATFCVGAVPRPRRPQGGTAGVTVLPPSV